MGARGAVNLNTETHFENDNFEGVIQKNLKKSALSKMAICQADGLEFALKNNK